MTNRVVIPFPVVQGRGEADIRRIADRFKSEPKAYRQYRRSLGVTLERVYWQHTPMGDFAVAYIESENGPAETFAAIAEDRSELGRWFVENVRDVHGVDVTQPPASLPETIGVWSDASVSERRRGMAFCAPALPEAVDKGKAFTVEAFSKDGMAESRGALGENLEVVTLNESPQGTVIGIYLEGDDPFEANRRFAASNEPFDRWFKDQCKSIFPPYVDFDQPVGGIVEIFDSEAVAPLTVSTAGAQ